MLRKIVAICLLLSACGLEYYPGGDLPTQERLKTIKKGDDRDKIIRVLGSPALTSPAFKDGYSFIAYAHNMKESRAFLDPKEVERDIYIYYFNAEDRLIEEKHLTLSDKRDIPYDPSETTVGGRELSLTDQLIQNFGRYNAGSQDSSVRH